MLEKTIFVLHFVASAIALGSVAASDFLHFKGLKNHKIEKKILSIYPYFSQFIFICLGFIILTGGIMLYNKPSLLNNSFFQLKMILVFIIIINGIFLNYRISPQLEKNIKKNHPPKTTKKLILESSLFGSISIISWLGVFILAFTKDFGYSVFNFISVYWVSIMVAFLISYFYQMNSHLVKN